jgi:hypothetical protein
MAENTPRWNIERPYHGWLVGWLVAGGTSIGIRKVVHSRWGAKKSKHSNYFHHGFFMVPLVASTFGHLHPDFLRFLWNFAQVDRNHPALFDLYRTGEVCHGY